MIYNFDQNNSGGYYAKPAQNIIVKDARDEKDLEHEKVAAQTLGE